MFSTLGYCLPLGSSLSSSPTDSVVSCCNLKWKSRKQKQNSDTFECVCDWELFSHAKLFPKLTEALWGLQSVLGSRWFSMNWVLGCIISGALPWISVYTPNAGDLVCRLFVATINTIKFLPVTCGQTHNPARALQLTPASAHTLDLLPAGLLLVNEQVCSILPPPDRPCDKDLITLLVSME